MSIDIKEIKESLKLFDAPDSYARELLAHDSPAVRQAAEVFLRKKTAECERLSKLSHYENELRLKGINYIAGIDEVGRGPLCGPVVAAAVILPPHCLLWGADDSKKLSEATRLRLEQEIKFKAVAWAVAGVNHRDIDKYNILNATYMAMKKALARLNIAPEHLLIDAVKLPDCAVPQTPIIKGDSLSISIAAASILAKSHRDRLMARFDVLYPQYGWERNKGYGTAEHRAVIAEHGYSPIHRKSFVLK